MLRYSTEPYGRGGISPPTGRETCPLQVFDKLELAKAPLASPYGRGGSQSGPERAFSLSGMPCGHASSPKGRAKGRSKDEEKFKFI